MSTAKRREYLTAMGLESWALRGVRPAAATDPAERAPQGGAASRSQSTAQVLPQSASKMSRSSMAPAEPAAASVSKTGTAHAGPPSDANAPGTIVQPGNNAPRKIVTPDKVQSTVVPPSDREAAFDWVQLRERVAVCTRCDLAATRTQTVFGVGNQSAEWLIVGEAPGAEEDRRGEPFVGRAGQLLDAMLRAIGLAREQVYIANMLKCRPPRNRDPAAGEVVQCSPYLERQVALLRPKIMLVVGRIAAQSLLRTTVPLGRLRQQVHAYGESQVPMVATYHPAYLLRAPTDKRKAWEDLKFAREVATRG